MHRPGRLARRRSHCVDRAPTSLNQSFTDTMRPQNLNRPIHGVALADGPQVNLQARGEKFNSVRGKQLDLFITDAASSLFFFRGRRSTLAADLGLPQIDQRSDRNIELTT